MIVRVTSSHGSKIGVEHMAELIFDSFIQTSASEGASYFGLELSWKSRAVSDIEVNSSSMVPGKDEETGETLDVSCKRFLVYPSYSYQHV